jgi:hypothetical protein
MEDVFIPMRVIEIITDVYSYAKEETDWVRIKNEILCYASEDERCLFSRRHPVTKKQRTNDFERKLMKLWTILGGRVEDSAQDP